MSDENSFDPKSWGKGVGGEAAAVEPSELPEAWRAVASPRPPVPAASLATPPRAAPSFQPFFAPAASLAILLAGAATAWGMRSVPAPVAAPVEMAPETAAPAEPAQAMSVRRLVLASLDDLGAALVAAGIAEAEARSAAQSIKTTLGNAGGEVRVVLNLAAVAGTTRLDRIEASYADGAGAIVDRNPDGSFAATRVAAELSKQIRVVSGELDADSFYSSAVSAGLTDSLIPEFINAFAFDFNLASEVSPGDTFEVAYETTVNAAGEPLGQPQLVFASLTTPTKSRALYRFKAAGEAEFGWFDGNGASTVRSFMRTPIDGARITSKFGPRFHPVLHYTRLHGGVDFAAPVGTPIYAAADGVVVSAAASSCAGNMVVMRHDNGWETRYFHLSRFAEVSVAGGRVTQGTTIGDVGNTGKCTTGPHLHYETHMNGEKVDPLSIKTEGGKKKGLEGTVLAAFRQARDRVDVARAQQVR